MTKNDKNKAGPFLAMSRSMDLIVETPNGIVHGRAGLEGDCFGPGPAGPQEHEGALNPPAMTGNRGGRPGKKSSGA